MGPGVCRVDRCLWGPQAGVRIVQRLQIHPHPVRAEGARGGQPLCLYHWFPAPPAGVLAVPSPRPAGPCNPPLPRRAEAAATSGQSTSVKALFTWFSFPLPRMLATLGTLWGPRVSCAFALLSSFARDYVPGRTFFTRWLLSARLSPATMTPASSLQLPPSHARVDRAAGIDCD